MARRKGAEDCEVMVITKLIGGLGNQMFQYAVARRIACYAGVPVKLDLSGFQNYPLRSYALDCFNVKAELASEAEVARFVERPGRWKRMATRILGTKGDLPPGMIKERSFRFDPELLSLEGDIYLDGYWQSEKYFREIEGCIRDEFTVKSDPEGLNRELAEMIKEVDAVSVHVRRGDYVSDPVTSAWHGTCSPRYYEQAAALIARTVRNPHFFVFSDDPAWAEQNIHLGYSSVHVKHNGPDRHFEDLRLMSSCRHHVIANSSFSWWGAWLGRSPGKIVIAPSRWFNTEEMDTSDLIPDTWIKLEA